MSSLGQAVGEPPLFLASSVFFAIKDAISAARAQSGITGPFRLDSPASAERIRNACKDRFTKLVKKTNKHVLNPSADRTDFLVLLWKSATVDLCVSVSPCRPRDVPPLVCPSLNFWGNLNCLPADGGEYLQEPTKIYWAEDGDVSGRRKDLPVTPRLIAPAPFIAFKSV